MRRRVFEALGAVVVIAVTISVCAIALAALLGCGSTATVSVNPNANGWPESAEFSTLETGQERFSSHSCGGGAVIVDHRTGVQYLMTASGICPLLDVDGTPLLVLEAGS